MGTGTTMNDPNLIGHQGLSDRGLKKLEKQREKELKIVEKERRKNEKQQLK
jgi:hypothetical protein